MGPFLHPKYNFPWLVFNCMPPKISLQASIQLQISTVKHRWSWSMQSK